METIYYPHFDLVSKGLIPQQNHVLNLKLLSLMCDQILVLPSHLLEVSYNELLYLYGELADYFNDGKIVSSIYQGQNSIADYYQNKLEDTNEKDLKDKYEIRIRYLLHTLYEEPHLIYRDNEKEKGMFQDVYNEANTLATKKTNNLKLKHSVKVFEEEFFNKSQRKGEYLNIKDVQEMTSELIEKQKIYKSHAPFFMKNMIGAYYYCGSLANSAITAYNPFFIDISYDAFSQTIPYKSSKIYSPDFFLNVLLGLRIVTGPSDIMLLSSKDIDEM